MSQKGVLIMNLGSPDSPKVGDVRRYLRQFLMDGRVIDAPLPIRFMIVEGFILPFRPKNSAEAYEQIWTREGSPLISSGRKTVEALRSGLDLPIELAMRYQNPSVKEGLGKLHEQGVTDCYLIPLFPHYAMSSFETAVEHVQSVAKKHFSGMKVEVIPPYYQHSEYLESLAARTRPYLEKEYDHLLFSFHGIPERHLRKSDPTGTHCLCVENCCEVESPAHAFCYRAQCFATVRELVKLLDIPKEKYSVSFQSRLGRDPWLKPYTDFEIPRLVEEGKKRMKVICPAFVSDCLETIEEIGMRGKELFEEAGGTDFELIPCLNEHPRWIDALTHFILEFEGKGMPENGA